MVKLLGSSNSKKKVRRYSKGRSGFFLTLPSLIVMGAIMYFPILWSLRISLYSSDSIITGTPKFVGFSNYINVKNSDRFQSALWQTASFVAVTIIIELIIGFAVALVLNRGLPRTRIYRILFSLPLMVAPVVSGLQWRWLFADQYGLVNYILSKFGIEGPLWLANPWGARSAVLIANVWLATPFVILVLLAALSSLPEELFEAARIDGANGIQIFRSITLPLLRPALLLILVIRLSDAFRVFDVVYILTFGGPGGATEVLSSYIYKLTFTSLRFGEGAAASFFVLIIISAVSYAFFKLLRPKEGEIG